MPTPNYQNQMENYLESPVPAYGQKLSTDLPNPRSASIGINNGNGF